MSTIGVDTGGTFTDLVYLQDDGRIEVAKRPSTPPEFSRGVIDVIDAIDKNRSILTTLDYFFHGTTVATNAMITGAGAKIGFITTAGHRDALPMMRIIGRSAGRSEVELKQYSYSDKPAPIVPKGRIKEVHERIDYKAWSWCRLMRRAPDGQCVNYCRKELRQSASAFCGPSRIAAMNSVCGRSSSRKRRISTSRFPAISFRR